MMLVLPCRLRFGVSSVVMLAVVMSAAGAAAVSVADEPQSDAATLQATEEEALRGVLTREQQAAYTPQKVLDTLLAGNRRFVADDLTQRNHSQRIREAYEGQFPKAVILSCLDSRIPVEDIFDLGGGKGDSHQIWRIWAVTLCKLPRFGGWHLFLPAVLTCWLTMAE